MYLLPVVETLVKRREKQVALEIRAEKLVQFERLKKELGK